MTKADDDWIPITHRLPADGIEVMTRDNRGLEKILVRRGRFWWLPDMSMHIYGNPVAWKPMEAASDD